MYKDRDKLKNQPDSPSAGGADQPRKKGLWSLLRLGACCAAPILALAILVPFLRGGDSGLAAIGGDLLYYAALLACPLGMYFMMRNMGRMQQGEKEEGHEKSGETKTLPPGHQKE